MCGIVAYTGSKESVPVLIGGLKKLEYRGYDSSGVAVLGKTGVETARSVGKIHGLEEKLKEKPLYGSTGIGHTRWATHGRPSEVNAHPHVKGAVAVVHNGIIENYLELRSELKATGSVFSSETDTEIFAHLIDAGVQKGLKLEAAVTSAIKRVRGSYAIAVVSSTEPGKIVGARMECPLVVGAGVGETLIASDVLAVLDFTRQVVFLDDGDVVTATKDGFTVTNRDGAAVVRKEKHIDWSPAMAEKGGYRHFMLKEIFEQPRAITDTMRGVVMEGEGDVHLHGFSIPLDEIKRIYIIACGTSWHASLVGKFYFEELTRIPTEVDLASEFRYRNPLVGKDTLVIAISQSGETADTLAAVAEAKRKGARVLAVCNVLESSLTREADFSFMTHAGPEIGVASTKAFTTQLVALYLLALYAGRRSDVIDEKRGRELVADLIGLPKRLDKALAMDADVERLAKKYFHHRDFLYLGRSLNYPIALEGALKLKEISYIHAEGYPAGEMKHGPIALIDEEMPVVILAPADSSYKKILSNMEEVKARSGKVIIIAEDGDAEASNRADDSLSVPTTPRLLTPVVMTVPLQLLAYHMAVLKGTDVDQPRNLAKSVTVE